MSEPAAGPERGQIPALTGVRALAAFLVFFHHHPTKFLIVGPLALWLEMHVGVTLFFVLSGFMITWRYDRRGPRPESFLRGYFVNRFARIYPLYLALMIPTMLLVGPSLRCARGSSISRSSRASRRGSRRRGRCGSRSASTWPRR